MKPLNFYVLYGRWINLVLQVVDFSPYRHHRLWSFRLENSADTWFQFIHPLLAFTKLLDPIPIEKSWGVSSGWSLRPSFQVLKTTVIDWFAVNAMARCSALLKILDFCLLLISGNLKFCRTYIEREMKITRFSFNNLTSVFQPSRNNVPYIAQSVIRELCCSKLNNKLYSITFIIRLMHSIIWNLFFNQHCDPWGFWPAQLSLSILSRKVFTECRCQRHVKPPNLEVQ